MLPGLDGGCMQAAPNFLASRTPAHAGIATGGFHLRSPTGASAYGTPLKASTPPLNSPSTAPAGECTTGPLGKEGRAKSTVALRATMHGANRFTCPLSGGRFVSQLPTQQQEQERRQRIERRQSVERELQRVVRMTGPQQVADRAEIRGPETEPDQIHHQEQQRSRQHALVGADRFLDERHGRRQIEVVEKRRNREKRERERPPGRPDEADEERDREQERRGGHETVRLLVAWGEAIDERPGHVHAGADEDADLLCLVIRGPA